MRDGPRADARGERSGRTEPWRECGRNNCAVKASGAPSRHPEQRYAYAFGHSRSAGCTEAERALRAFIEAHPDSELTGSTYYWLSEPFYVRNDLKQAAVYFARGYQDFRSSIKAPDNLLKLGMSLARLGRMEDAYLTFGALSERFPNALPLIRERAEAESRRAGYI